jgi:hypothetical protein
MAADAASTAPETDPTSSPSAKPASRCGRSVFLTCSPCVLSFSPVLPLKLNLFRPQPLVLSTKMTATDRATLPTHPIAEVCRSVVISLLDASLPSTGNAFLSFLALLPFLPACTSVHFDVSPAAVEALWALLNVQEEADFSPVERMKAAIPGLEAAVKRIEQWNFGWLEAGHLAPFLALASSSLKHFDLFAEDCALPAVRKALTSCAHLESLSLSEVGYLNPVGNAVGWTGFVDETWLQEPFSFLPGLSSLEIGLLRLTDPSVLHFIVRFQSLTTLDLSVGRLRLLPDDAIPLPSLTHLMLSTDSVRSFTSLLRLFRLPALTHLTLHLPEDPDQTALLPPRFIRSIAHDFPSLRSVEMLGGDVSWCDGAIEEMEQTLAAAGISFTLECRSFYPVRPPPRADGAASSDEDYWTSEDDEQGLWADGHQPRDGEWADSSDEEDEED